MKVKIVFLGIIIVASTCFTACSITSSSNDKVKFENTEIKDTNTLANIWQITKAYWKDTRTHATPKAPIPLNKLTTQQLLDINDDVVIRLGHSTVLLKLNGDFILIDPMFSERAFAVQWMGPKRFHPSPISIADLPPISAVVISHDHYDHLDKDSIKQLASKTERFVTPLKVGSHLHSWGIENNQIIELDWHQEFELNKVKLTATPSQHFSGRSLFDKDHTLWASWVITSSNSNIFYSGDSGYFSGFKQIGEQYGPFDLTLIETGAYNELWADIHMKPEQSLQAHLDVKGKVMMPVHNGTFDLALHNWFEPLQIVTDLAQQQNVAVTTPIFGQIVSIKNPEMTNKWWQPEQLLSLLNNL